MPAILLRLHPPRPDFPSDPTDAEAAAMADHAAWWQELADAGRAAAAGPVLDPAGVRGLAIVIADSEAAALRWSRTTRRSRRGWGSAIRRCRWAG